MTSKEEHVGFTLSPSEEFIYAIKTICEEYNVNSKDLMILPDQYRFDSIKEQKDCGICFVKSIPIKIPLPKNMTSKQMPHFDLVQKSWDTTVKYYAGIGEQYCAYGDFDGPLFKNPNKIQFWTFYGQQEGYPVCVPVIIVRTKDWTKLYKTFTKFVRRKEQIEPPILPQSMLYDLYQNTIGFLLRGKEQYEKYSIPFKRGIILAGEAGLGKTLSCRWLKQLCRKYSWHTRVISLQDVSNARMKGRMDTLFAPFKNKKGIIFFDDIDALLAKRETGNIEVSNFLTGLDGIDVKEGTVYVFTTNKVEGLDKAVIRPNRIDLILRFESPNEKLKREFIVKKFPKEILDAIDIDDCIEKTEDYSFAELEEIRRLFCIDLMENKKTDLERVFSLYQLHRSEMKACTIGFNSSLTDPSDNYYDHDDANWDFGNLPWLSS